MNNSESSQCDIYFKLISDHKVSFGPRFDSIDYASMSGASVKGSELRELTNGCETVDALGLGWLCRCRAYDEQLQFVDINGVLLSHTDFQLKLSTGKTIRGRTDANGCTERIQTHLPTFIESVEFPRSSPLAGYCCIAEEEEEEEEEPRTERLREVQTSKEGFGNSKKRIVLKNDERGLTNSEIACCRLLFKDSVDYTKVKVHGSEYLLFGLQDDDTAMTPNGEIYFNEKHYKEDYTLVSNTYLHWFIHEMVHVWQYQLGYPVKSRGAIRMGLDYHYTLAEGGKLGDYNMEAQGDLLADFFILKYRADRSAMSVKTWFDELPLYEDTLSAFLENPRLASHLP